MPFIYLILNVQTISRYMIHITLIPSACSKVKSVSTILIQREQYRGTVHLFIGNRTASYDITFIPSKITYKVYKCYRDNIVIFT